MMLYFFIFGRNPILSRAELLSYIKSRGKNFSEIIFRKNWLIAETGAEFDIQELGGVIQLGRIIFSGAEAEFKKFLGENDLVEKQKFTYSVIGNTSEDLLKEKFKQEKQKAFFRRGRRELKMQRGESVLIPNAEVGFFLYSLEDKIYFGKVEQDYSYSEIKKRDMKKPVRRQSLAISPRLAKILVNLSQAKPNQLLLDPFCGVGGILQEALIKKINVYGIDKDKKTIAQSRENLRWLEKNYKIESNYKLLNADARQAPNIKVDAIVAEPQLGELLRKKPSDSDAKKMICNFEKMIISVLRKLKKLAKPGAKIVLTMPSIKNQSVNLNNLCRQTNLKISSLHDVRFPIKEFRENQFVSRDIVVLE